MQFAVVAPLLLASLPGLVRAQAASKTSKKAKTTKGGKSSTPVPPPEDACQENGYEVWQQRPNADVGLKLATTVDTATCSYELTLSFKPDPDFPLLNGPTADSFVGMPPEEYSAMCEAEGFAENAVPPILSAEQHVGLNSLYTDFAYGIDLSERARAAIGFKIASLGASPCGTFLQPWPQYSIHFYTITTEERKQMTCVSEGGYFCKSFETQCSDAGRKFNMNGAGLATCPDALPGPPMYQNIPQGFFWTIDGNPVVGVNAASPAMGLHAVDPSEFAPGRDRKEPFTLMLNYDQEVIGNHVLIWSGMTTGAAPDLLPYTKETPTYNCQSEDKSFMPTTTVVDYDEETMYTSVTVMGPLLDCSGDSFTEVEDSSHSSKASKSKSGKGSTSKGSKKAKIVEEVVEEVLDDVVQEGVELFD